MNKLPGPVIVVVSNVLGDHYYSHRRLESLFAEKGAPGDPPPGNCVEKCTAWFKLSGEHPTADAASVLGGVLETFMEVDATYERFLGHQAEGRKKINDILSRYGLAYQVGGRILGANTATPTRSLEESLRSRNIGA